MQDVPVRVARVLRYSRGDWLVEGAVCTGRVGRELIWTGSNGALRWADCADAMLHAASFVALYWPGELGEQSKGLPLVLFLDDILDAIHGSIL